MLKAELVRVQTELSLDCHLGDGCVCMGGGGPDSKIQIILQGRQVKGLLVIGYFYVVCLGSFKCVISE